MRHDDLLAAAERIAAHGSVEREVYAVDDDGDDFEVSAKIGAALGYTHETISIDRRLVEATVRMHGAELPRRTACAPSAG